MDFGFDKCVEVGADKGCFVTEAEDEEDYLGSVSDLSDNPRPVDYL